MRKTVKRATLVLALTPLVSLPTTAAFAGGTGLSGTTHNVVTTTKTPAPAGDASGVAAEVNGIVAVGKTSAHAGSDGGKASGDALDLLGTRVVGGDQDGVGSNDGNLIGTGDTPLGDAEVAPWSAKVTDDNDGYQAMAEAALAHANLADVAEIWLLHSKSRATWSEDKSTGDAESDGAEVSALGMLDVKVLHSEAHSDGTSKADILVVNGTEIGSSDDANGACQLVVPDLLTLICLTAEGGTSHGVTTSGGTVAGIDVGGGAIVGTISGTTSQGGTAGTPDEPPARHHPQHNGGSNNGGHTIGKPSTSTLGGLPFTGAETGRLGALAAAFAALGGAMVAFGRRRRAFPYAV